MTAISAKTKSFSRLPCFTIRCHGKRDTSPS